MSPLSQATDPQEEVLSREIRRLTTKCVLEQRKRQNAEDTVKRLEPLAALVPGLQKEISDLKLDFSASTRQLHEANANLASSRKKLLEADFASGRALVEAEQRLLACEEEGAAASQIAAKKLKDSTDELMKVKQQLSAVKSKRSDSLQEAEERIMRIENTNSVALKEAEKNLIQADEKSAAALQDVEKRLANAEATHRASLQEAKLKLAEVEARWAGACREAEQKLAESEARRHSLAGPEVEKELAVVGTASCSGCRELENRLADAEAKNALALQAAEKKLVAAELKSSAALRTAEYKLKDTETKLSSALKKAEETAKDVESIRPSEPEKTEKILTDAVKQSPDTMQEAEQKLAVSDAESLAAVREAERKMQEALRQRDEAILKTKRTVADLSAKVAAAEEDAKSWKQSCQECDFKLSTAVAKLEAGAGVATGMGNTFSPAPLGTTVLGHPADRNQVSDVASESRSRFTLNLPFEIDSLEPGSMQLLDNGVDDVPVPRSEMPRKRRRVDPQEDLKAKDHPSAGTKRTLVNAHSSPLKSRENGDAESSQCGENFSSPEASARMETETESLDRRRVTVGSHVVSPPFCRDETDGFAQSRIVGNGKGGGEKPTGTGRGKNAARSSSLSQRKAIQKTVRSKEKFGSVNGVMKDVRVVPLKRDSTGNSSARGARKAVVSGKAIARSGRSGTGKTTPVTEPPVTNQLKSRPLNLTRGRPTRKRNQVSYDYSVASGRDVCKDMLH